MMCAWKEELGKNFWPGGEILGDAISSEESDRGVAMEAIKYPSYFVRFTLSIEIVTAYLCSLLGDM